MNHLAATIVGDLDNPASDLAHQGQTLDYRPTGSARHIIDAHEARLIVDAVDTILIDVRNPQTTPNGYIPGAVLLDPQALYRQCGKIEGLMPASEDLAKILSRAGIQPNHRVIIYDDETGVDAARLGWLLEAIGHTSYALLSGGYEGWVRNQFPISARPRDARPRGAQPTRYPPRAYLDGIDLNKHQVLAAIDSDDIVILDTRTIAEYNGKDKRADRAGRIPGAVHVSWDELIDYYDTGEILPSQEINEILRAKNIGYSNELIVYCQSNRRSALAFVVLKDLGYRVSTYTGSWSEWGNDISLPIEI